MKKSLTGMLALLAGATVAYGQGAIELGDFGSTLNTYIYVSFKPATGSSVLLGGNSGTPPTPTLANYAAEAPYGAEWTVQLYGAIGSGLPAASLSPLAGETATFADGKTGSGTGHDNVAGTWASSAVYTFPSGAPQGTVATFQLYAWYNDGGTITSYATAVADGVPAGSSSTMSVALQAAPNSPNFEPQFGSFTVSAAAVPEPSTIALGVIGASAFLMRLRRKQ